MTAIMPAVDVLEYPINRGSATALQCPITAETAPKTALIKIIIDSRSVSSRAAAGGTMNIATTRMLPTLSKLATAVMATSVISK